jgi:hypothetical protein
MPHRRSRDPRNRKNSKKKRSIVEPHHSKGLTDEGALHHIQQSSDKAFILKQRLSKGGSQVTEEALERVYQDLEDYMQLERVVAFNRQNLSKKYHAAKEIDSKEERRSYLDGLKAKREEQRDIDKAARDVAREKYLAIKAVVDELLTKKEL